MPPHNHKGRKTRSTIGHKDGSETEIWTGRTRRMKKEQHRKMLTNAGGDRKILRKTRKHDVKFRRDL